NVHDDTNRPFLRDDIDVLCARCHTERQFVNGVEQAVQGDWGSAYYGTGNPGSHPMGTDVYNDRDTPEDSPVNLTAAGVFTYSYGATGAYNLGGHLTDGGTTPGSGSGVTCVTCHAVHGVQPDSDPPAGGTPPVPNLLTIAQPTAGGAYGGSVYDGNGDPRNALCEGCHNEGTATTIDPATGLTYSGSYNPNPGAQGYTHPCDDLGASGSAGVAAFPTDWPEGSSPGANVDPGPICETCHTPHPNHNEPYRPTILSASGSPILRATDVCGQCHGGGAGSHHPAGVSMGSLSDSAIENGDGILNCGDCHGGAQQSAHNWQQPGSFNLDPDWEPNTTGGTNYSDNGRTYEETTNKRFVPGSSKECADCHLSASPNPAPYAHHATGSETEYGEYQDTGTASHYLGDTNAGALNYANGNCPDGTAFNATTMDWPGGGWSRFDANGVNRIVCESCHDVQSSKNVPGTALLLHRYVEGDTDFTSTGYSYASELCEGCHGQNPSGKTHPLTGDIVDSTGLPLDSINNNPPAANPPNGNATYPGGTSRDSMNCDSCHQPHDADTNGGTYILEDNVTGTATGNTRGASIPDLRYNTFCKECHTDY
ncbi:hypothetical protein HZA56_03185, partial [Candidatus Poribacteria bacterium]|nr:hypothetical protein [Candidatus Poribacteria bacterium]